MDCIHYHYQMADGTQYEQSSSKRRKTKCSICGIEGHRANNKYYHPGGNPNAKIGLSRSSKKNADSQPIRNIGEIDDELPAAELNSAKDDDSDDSDDDIWGTDTLYWAEDPKAHDQVQPTANDKFGHPLPAFKGPEPGIFMEHIQDINPIRDYQVMLGQFFDQVMFDKMVVATNSFGRLYVKKWKDTTRTEMSAFLGLIIYMGLISYTGERPKLWENTWKGNVFVRSVMLYARFERILRAWHYTDYEQYTADEIKECKAKDPFWPVAEFERDLNQAFGAMLKPDQFLDIDEQCIPWKGRHKCRCYNKSKPVKRHFKVFSLNDSRSGYQEGFYLYRGKAEDRPDDIPASTYPATILLNKDKYKNQNYILCTDNWFTSFPQISTCLKFGIHMVGTVQKKRKGIPFSWKPPHGVQQTKQRGEFLSLQSVFYESEEMNDEVYYTSWMDRKPVALLHTFPTKMGFCSRMVKTINGGWERKEYTRPTIVPIYNHGMGGTDSGDQRLEAYRPELKTKSWVPRVLCHFLNSAIVNAFIWYSKAFPQHPLTHYKFREILVDEMVDAQLEEMKAVTGKTFERSISKKRWSKEQSRKIGAHWPVQLRKPKGNRIEGLNPKNPINQRTRNWLRGGCMMCGRSVDTKCEQCRVWLCCVFKQNNQSTCFRDFHTLPNFDYQGSVMAEDGSEQEEEADEDD